MRLKKFSWILLAALCCCFCGGGSLIKKSSAEVDQYLQNNPDLPATDKACLEDGRFEIGMLTETLLFLLNEPTQKETVKEKWGKQEHWIYLRGGKKTFIVEGNHVVGIIDK